MSLLTPPALDYLEVMLHFTSHWLYNLDACTSTYLIFPVLQLVGSFLPLVAVKFAIWCSNLLFYPLMWVIWWTMYLASVWKYIGVTGRTFAEILADPHRDTIANRSEYEKYLTVNGLLVDMK